MDSFELNCFNYFLTWSQCPVPKEDCLEQLVEKYGDFEYIICEEDHIEPDEQGCVGQHLHALIHFENKKHIRSQFAFDIEGEQTYHCHIEGARSFNKVYNYVAYYGDIITNMEGLMEEEMPRYRSQTSILNELAETHFPMADLASNLYKLRDPNVLSQFGYFNLDKLTKGLNIASTLLYGTRLRGQVKAYWWFGDTSLHKSAQAVATCLGRMVGLDEKAYLTNIYPKTTDDDWWPGYAGEKTIIFDDFPDRDPKWAMSTLKHLINKMPYALALKGSHFPCLADTILITAQHDPEYYVRGCSYKDVRAVVKRFDVTWVTGSILGGFTSDNSVHLGFDWSKVTDSSNYVIYQIN